MNKAQEALIAQQKKTQREKKLKKKPTCMVVWSLISGPGLSTRNKKTSVWLNKHKSKVWYHGTTVELSIQGHMLSRSNAYEGAI